MADLSLSSGGGSQTSAPSPQSLVNSGTQTEASTKVQPGTDSSVVAPSSISLNNSNLTLTNLAGLPQTTTQSKVATVPTAQVTKHHVNTALLGLCIVLLIVAACGFWFVSRSEKNTTNYY